MTDKMEKPVGSKSSEPEQIWDGDKLKASWIEEHLYGEGADDIGFVPIDSTDIKKEREDTLKVFPQAKSFISFVVRMNREPVKSPARSISNLEFHHSGELVNEISRKIVGKLERIGVKALNPSMGFPMEVNEFPKQIWVISHKPIAVAAGLGKMGIHRNVIHPKFGNFILIGTIAIDKEIAGYTKAIDYNPCVECKLCVAVCPVGAIASDGHFNFSACYTHNYREFLGGFNDWVETVSTSSSKKELRSKVKDTETISVWQSLSFGPNYKSAYCMSVCPAGEDVISAFKDSKKEFISEVVKPLQQKVEPVYVVKGSDAEDYVTKRYPHKEVRHVAGTLRPNSVSTFLGGLRTVFQREKSSGINSTIHFKFYGKEEVEATVKIVDKTLTVLYKFEGTPDLTVNSDSKFWIKFLDGESNLVFGLLMGKLKFKGNPKHLLAFQKCFPS